MNINDFDFDGMTGFILGYGVAIMVILAIVFLCTIATGVIPNESVPALIGCIGYRCRWLAYPFSVGWFA